VTHFSRRELTLIEPGALLAVDTILELEEYL
jgi:hypothetical protein